MAKLNHLTTRIGTTVLAGTVLATALLAGCQNAGNPKPPVAHGEQFDPAGTPRSVGRLAEAQAAAGAQADGMLYDRNFHGEKLNSLGQTKLDLIVKGTPTGDPVVVYLDMPKDSLEGRKTAVVAYLKDAGLPEENIKLVDGPNTGDTTPTAANLSRLYKAKDNSFGGETSDDNGEGAAPAAK